MKGGDKQQLVSKMKHPCLTGRLLRFAFGWLHKADHGGKAVNFFHHSEPKAND